MIMKKSQLNADPCVWIHHCILTHFTQIDAKVIFMQRLNYLPFISSVWISDINIPWDCSRIINLPLKSAYLSTTLNKYSSFKNVNKLLEMVPSVSQRLL